MSGQDLANLPPPPLHLLPGLDESLLTRLSSESPYPEFPVDFLHPRPDPPGFASLLGSIDTIELG
ncbi:MAG: hypothetical protein ACREUL_05520 [Steroidobacteraceae bacterium]